MGILQFVPSFLTCGHVFLSGLWALQKPVFLLTMVLLHAVPSFFIPLHGVVNEDRAISKAGKKIDFMF